MLEAVVPMTTTPHSAADLALAPVLINIERNLTRLRDSEDIEYELALELNDDSSWYHTAEERAQRLQQLATRGVDTHGWEISPTADGCGLFVSHGGYHVSVMFGKVLAGYVETGAFPELPAAAGI